MVRCSCPRQGAERPMSFLLLSWSTIVNLPLIKIPENATHAVHEEHLGILQYDTTMDNSHTLLWTEVLNYSPRFSNVQQSLGFVPYGPMFLPPRQDAQTPMFHNYCELAIDQISGNYAILRITFWKPPVWYYTMDGSLTLLCISTLNFSTMLSNVEISQNRV